MHAPSGVVAQATVPFAARSQAYPHATLPFAAPSHTAFGTSVSSTILDDDGSSLHTARPLPPTRQAPSEVCAQRAIPSPPRTHEKPQAARPSPPCRHAARRNGRRATAPVGALQTTRPSAPAKHAPPGSDAHTARPSEPRVHEKPHATWPVPSRMHSAGVDVGATTSCPEVSKAKRRSVGMMGSWSMGEEKSAKAQMGLCLKDDTRWGRNAQSERPIGVETGLNDEEGEFISTTTAGTEDKSTTMKGTQKTSTTTERTPDTSEPAWRFHDEADENRNTSEPALRSPLEPHLKGESFGHPPWSEPASRSPPHPPLRGRCPRNAPGAVQGSFPWSSEDDPSSMTEVNPAPRRASDREINRVRRGRRRPEGSDGGESFPPVPVRKGDRKAGSAVFLFSCC
jgi:hypothetical protein